MVGLSADLLSAAKVGPWTYVHTVELCPFLLGPEASKANKLELAARRYITKANKSGNAIQAVRT